MALRDQVNPHIRELSPYVPGKPIEELERELGISESVKLASNENPLGPSPKEGDVARQQRQARRKRVVDHARRIFLGRREQQRVERA